MDTWYNSRLDELDHIHTLSSNKEDLKTLGLTWASSGSLVSHLTEWSNSPKGDKTCVAV